MIRSWKEEGVKEVVGGEASRGVGRGKVEHME
jgi:hypothetical protein